MLIFSEIGDLVIVVGGTTENPAKAFQQFFPINYAEQVFKIQFRFNWDEGAGISDKEKLRLRFKIYEVNENPSESDILKAEKELSIYADYAENIRHIIDIPFSGDKTKMYKVELWQYVEAEPVLEEKKILLLQDFVMYLYSPLEAQDIFTLSILDRVKLEAEIQGADQDEKITAIIYSAVSLITKALRYPLYETNIVEYISIEERNKYVPLYPIDTIDKVKIYNIAGVDMTQEAIRAIQNKGLLFNYNLSGEYKLEYTTGYAQDAIPSDLINAIIDQTIFMYKYRQQGIEVVNSRTSGQGQTTSYRHPPDMLSNLAKQLIEPYRYWGQG